MTPLDDRSVLLTRAPERTAGLTRQLEALGARVQSLAALAFEPPRDLGAVARAVARLVLFDWVVFTSVNGVRHFASALAERGIDPSAVPAVAAVGQRTAREARSAGLWPAIVAEEANAEGLASELVSECERGARVLVVRPEVTRPVLVSVLEEARLHVESVAFYRTVPGPEAATIARSLSRGEHHAVVFSSPSAVSAVDVASTAGLARLLRDVKVVALGEVTAAALAGAGRAADRRAADPGDSAVAAALVEVLAG